MATLIYTLPSSSSPPRQRLLLLMHGGSWGALLLNGWEGKEIRGGGEGGKKKKLCYFPSLFRMQQLRGRGRRGKESSFSLSCGDEECQGKRRKERKREEPKKGEGGNEVVAGGGKENFSCVCREGKWRLRREPRFRTLWFRTIGEKAKHQIHIYPEHFFKRKYNPPFPV